MPSRRIAFPNRDGFELAARLDLPTDGPRAFAIFAHCFTCSKESHAVARVSRALCERGLAVLRFDFTGLGDSGGDFADTDFSSNVGDLLDAVAFLRSGYEAPRLLVGHSLGGAAVLAAAGEAAEVTAVCTIAAPFEARFLRALLAEAAAEQQGEVSLEVEIMGRRFLMRRDFLRDLEQRGLADRIAGMNKALLVCHSPQDEVVSLDNATEIYRAARHPKSFLSVDGANHLLQDPDDAQWVASVLAAWVGRYLDPDAGGGHRLV